MHRGEIRERGTHRSLFEKNGLYSSLYRLQASELDDEFTGALSGAALTT